MPRAAIQIAIRSERSPKGLVQPVVAERLLGKLCSTERLSVLVRDDACSYGGPEAQTDSTERKMVSTRVCFNTRARMVVNFAAASPGQGAEDGAEEALGAQRAPQTQSSQTLRAPRARPSRRRVGLLKLHAQSGGPSLLGTKLAS